MRRRLARWLWVLGFSVLGFTVTGQAQGLIPDLLGLEPIEVEAPDGEGVYETLESLARAAAWAQALELAGLDAASGEVPPISRDAVAPGFLARLGVLDESLFSDGTRVALYQVSLNRPALRAELARQFDTFRDPQPNAPLYLPLLTDGQRRWLWEVEQPWAVALEQARLSQTWTGRPLSASLQARLALETPSFLNPESLATLAERTTPGAFLWVLMAEVESAGNQVSGVRVLAQSYARSLQAWVGPGFVRRMEANPGEDLASLLSRAAEDLMAPLVRLQDERLIWRGEARQTHLLNLSDAVFDSWGQVVPRITNAPLVDSLVLSAGQGSLRAELTFWGSLEHLGAVLAGVGLAVVEREGQATLEFAL